MKLTAELEIILNRYYTVENYGLADAVVDIEKLFASQDNSELIEAQDELIELYDNALSFKDFELSNEEYFSKRDELKSRIEALKTK